MRIVPQFLQKAATRRRADAFTMIEIAIALGVIGFALVAIVGVLPLGLNAQKDNREDTIINQDSVYFMEAIKGGIKGLDGLVDHVDEVTITTFEGNTTTVNVYTNGNGLDSGSNIVGYLSYPKYIGTNVTNIVTAHVHALSGSAMEQSQIDEVMAFHYELTSEVMPFGSSFNTLTNLYEVRLTFRWPLVNDKLPSRYKQMVVTGMVSGKHEQRSGTDFYYFKPLIY